MELLTVNAQFAAVNVSASAAGADTTQPEDALAVPDSMYVNAPCAMLVPDMSVTRDTVRFVVAFVTV